MLFRRRRIRSVILWLVACALFYVAGQEFRYVFYFCVALFFIFPWASYRGIVRLVDQHPMYTNAKTVTFGPAGVVVAGPNYRSELGWSMFKHFSEDGTYFYLRQSDYTVDSVLPKAAFTPQKQEEFRRYGNALNAQGKSR